MDFGGSALNKSYNSDNAPRGSRRMTSDVFALATAVSVSYTHLFQKRVWIANTAEAVCWDMKMACIQSVFLKKVK